MKQQKEKETSGIQVDAEDATKTPGITLLVDHTHAIPVGGQSISPRSWDWT